MANHLVQNAKTLMEGATYGGGLAWITTNSSALTAIAVISTALASMYFGRARKKTDERNATANEERNTINRRDITSAIINDLRKAGKSDEYIEDLQVALRNQ